MEIRKLTDGEKRKVLDKCRVISLVLFYVGLHCFHAIDRCNGETYEAIIDPCSEEEKRSLIKDAEMLDHFELWITMKTNIGIQKIKKLI